jgi:hypothetical protein
VARETSLGPMGVDDHPHFGQWARLSHPRADLGVAEPLLFAFGGDSAIPRSAAMPLTRPLGMVSSTVILPFGGGRTSPKDFGGG